MSSSSSSVRRGFRNILVFSGRDTPAQFWPFAGVILGVVLVVGNLLFILLVSVSTAIGSSSEEDLQNELPSLIPLIALTACGAAFTAFVLAAAVTRRLHDRNHRGGWAVIPLVFLGAGLIMFGFVTKSFERTADPDPMLFFIVFANNVVYFVCLAFLVWQLIRSGTNGENRFGAPGQPA